MSSIIQRAVRSLFKEGPISFLYRSKEFASRRIVDTVEPRIARIGSSRECPICGFTGSRFLTGNRPENLCPDCGACERHRLLWRYLSNQTCIFDRDGPVCYFAPTWSVYRQLAERLAVLTTDLTMSRVDCHTDIQSLPFHNGSFETIICSHVLEHVPDDRIAMNELYRVLEPGGACYILVPIDDTLQETKEDPSVTTSQERGEIFGQGNHVRLYGMDIKTRLQQAGFELNTVWPSRKLDRRTVNREGIIIRDKSAYIGFDEDQPVEQHEPIFECRKPK